MENPFTHLNAEGRARMVDVTAKTATERLAVARGSVTMAPETLAAIAAGKLAKGDVLAVAQVAGVMAAKQTGQWIPMCHPLPITGVDLSFRLDRRLSRVEIEARVKVYGPTGVEMEALTAVSAAALTIYDMAKALDKGMTMGPVYLARKEGGKSGPFQQARACVSALAGHDEELGALLLRGGDRLYLAAWEGPGHEGAADEAAVEGPAAGAPAAGTQVAGTRADGLPVVWLTARDFTPGTCLEAGTLRLALVEARGGGWLAEVRQAGVLRVGDWLTR